MLLATDIRNGLLGVDIDGATLLGGGGGLGVVAGIDTIIAPASRSFSYSSSFSSGSRGGLVLR